jgi:hypothetical protein
MTTATLIHLLDFTADQAPRKTRIAMRSSSQPTIRIVRKIPSPQNSMSAGA